MFIQWTNDPSVHEPAAPSVVARAGAVLRAVSQVSGAPSDPIGGGISTSELARRTGLARPTAHRLLVSLAAEGLLDRDHQTGRWHLGPELYFLGATAALRYDVTRHAQVSVERLAAATGESAFFSARRGDETVCLLRRDGSFPIRSFVLFEGARFPLGVVSAGLVILAFLRERDVAAYLARRDLVPEYGEAHGPAAVAERLAQTRSDGYAVNPGLIVEGSWGMAAAVFDAAGRPEWALTLTGIESRFRPERRADLERLLLDEALSLGRAIASS